MRGYRVTGGLAPSWKEGAARRSVSPVCRSCGRPMQGQSRYHEVCDRCWREAAARGEAASAGEVRV